jgi:hypothetical protein
MRRGLIAFSILMSLLLGVASTADAFFNVLLMKKRATSTCDTANSGLVQVSNLSYPNSSSVVTNFYSAQTAGNLNVVIFGWYNSTSATVTSVTDTAGNSYTLAVGPIRSATNNLYIYYAKNIAASAAGNQVTVTTSATLDGSWLSLAEYTGLDTVSPLDGTTSGTGATAAISTGSLTTNNACDVLINATYTDGAGIKTGTGFTNRSNAWGDFMQDRVVSTTGSYSASATQLTSVGYASGLIALKKNLGTQALNPIRNIQWNAYPMDGASDTQNTLQFMSPQTAGNLNVVVVSWGWNAGNVTSVTDSAGNTYTQIGSIIRGTNLSQAVFYAKNIASYAAGNTVTVNLDQGQIATIEILEYTGLSTTSPLDQYASATGSSTTPTSASVTTTYANELVLGITRTSASTKLKTLAGSGFRVRAMDSVSPSIFVQDKVVLSTGSYNSTATLPGSYDWISHVVTFH